jgi:hypothetical protein
VSLLAIWTGFGGKSLPWRILALVLAIGLWSRLVAWTVDRPDAEQTVTGWTWVLLAQTAAILIPVWLARLRGVRLTPATGGDRVRQTASRRGPFQFSVGYLLSWMTVLAIVLGLAQYTFHHDDLFWAVAAWKILVAYPLSQAALALAGLWVVLGTARLWLRFLLLALATAAAIIVNHLCAGLQDLWPYTAFCVLQVVWLAASLSVFRVAGYRMTQIPRSHAEEPPPSPDAG